MTEELEKWDRTKDGLVRYDHVVEVGVAAANPFSIVLRVDYVTSQDHLNRVSNKKSKPRRVQLSMPPETAERLASLLQKYARGLQSTIPAKDKQN